MRDNKISIICALIASALYFIALACYNKTINDLKNKIKELENKIDKA